jgi:DNA-binding NarL/FixJ family response regulator
MSALSMTRRPRGDDDVRTVFLIDGWPAFRRSLLFFVEAAGHRVVGEADSVDRATSAAGLESADVVIIDPGEDWVDVRADLAKLRRAAPTAAVVLLTAEPLPQRTVAKAVQAGVSACLTKCADPVDVLRAIDVAGAGVFTLVPRHVPTGEPREPSFSHAASVALPGLTRREQEMLLLIASGYSGVYRKLGVGTRADAIQAARSLGLT